MSACPFCNPPEEAARESGFLFLPSQDPARVEGWMVLAPERHVEGWDRLTPKESRVLGDLIRRGVQSVRAATGAPKVYVAVFAEQVPHLHVHLFPRGPGVPPERRGPRLLFEATRGATAESTAAAAAAILETFRRA